MASALPGDMPRVRSEPTVRIPPLEATAVLPDIVSADSVAPATPVVPPEPEPVTDPGSEREVVAAGRTARHSRGRPPWFRTAAIVALTAIALLIATITLALVGDGGRAPAQARFPSVTPSIPVSVSPAPNIDESPAGEAPGGQADEHGNKNGFENGHGNKHGED